MPTPPRLRSIVLAAGAALSLNACSAYRPEPFSPSLRPTAAFPNIGYASWSDTEPEYRFYPGDQIEVRTPSAPELNKIVTLQPDGRVSLPLIGAVMLADHSVSQAEAMLTEAYSTQLVRPDTEVTLVAATPLKVFVGGQVDHPGVYDMAGPMDALQAVIQAGGFTSGARRAQVVIIRRGPDGTAMMRTVDLREGVSDPAYVNVGPLRRFDVVYVPRTSISEAGQAMQQYVRDMLPAEFSYTINKVL